MNYNITLTHKRSKQKSITQFPELQSLHTLNTDMRAIRESSYKSKDQIHRHTQTHA